MTTTRPLPSSRLAPRESSDRELPSLIQRSPQPLVVESYHAAWETPWRGLSDAAWRELFHDLGERVDGAALETGRNRELAVRFGLEVIPTVLVFLGGEVVARFTGTVSAETVVAAVRRALAQAHVIEADRLELEAVAAAHQPLSPVRSILRRRARDEREPALAHAG